MAEFTFNKTDLEQTFSKIKKRLFNSKEIHVIKYERKDTELNYTKNNGYFIDAIKGKPAVYCIWLGQESSEKFVPVYIGHAKKPRDRLRNHLSKKHEKTGAVLDKVKKEVKRDVAIGVTFVQIEPPYMRTAVEEWLIEEHSDILTWNERGKR